MRLRTIIADAAVRSARARIHARDSETLAEQLRITLIPAPSGSERQRADYVLRRFTEIGLEEVGVDGVGNVLGSLPGALHADGEIVAAAHLDTVFGPEVEIRERRAGERLLAPGITDNGRGLAALLALAEVLAAARIRTRHPIRFVATVGEEGVGDLRGAKHLFREGGSARGAAGLIAIDGAGLSRIVHRAIGSYRIRATFRGLGGHSWGDRGLANPVHALGLAVARLRDLRLEGCAEFAINVGRIGGGTSVNAIPEQAWMEVDLRSEDAATLRQLTASVRALVEGAAREEGRSSRRDVPVVATIETVGDRPGGAIAADTPLVADSIAATRLLGVEPELVASSTDANVAISLGIPAIAIGAGGEGGGAHTLDEWYENRDGPVGIERALLTLLAAAGLTDRQAG